MDGKDDWGAYGSTAAGNLVFAAARSVTEFTGRTKKWWKNNSGKGSYGEVYWKNLGNSSAVAFKTS